MILVGFTMMSNHFVLSYFVELKIATAWQPRREARSCGDTLLCLSTWGETRSELSWWLGAENYSWEKRTSQLSVLTNLLISAEGYCIISEATFPPGFELWPLLRSTFFFSEEDDWHGGGQGWHSWHLCAGSQPLPSPPSTHPHGESFPGSTAERVLVQLLWGWLALTRGSLGTSRSWELCIPSLCSGFSHTWVESPVAIDRRSPTPFHRQHPFERLSTLLSSQPLVTLRIWT